MPISITKKLRSPLAQILKDSPDAVSVLKQDELVEAKYIGKTNKAVFFDLGRNGTGIVYGVELINAQDALKDKNPGDISLAKVIDSENDDGYVELSLRETQKQQMWEEVKEFFESGELLNVKIEAANTGGLVTEVHGLQAFLPVSQLAAENYPDVVENDRSKIFEELKKFVGQEMQVKVIDVNSRTNKLIVSQRATAVENIKERLDKYHAGDVIDGIITGVADFGAFIKFADDPEVEGLIHISELDHRLIDNPKEIVKIDDVVKAKIIEIKNGRVSLSLKALTVNPWDEVENKYKVGQEVMGTVNRFNPFGAFVSLDEDIQGLIHVSKFGSVEEMQKRLGVGKSYPFIIELVKPEEKRIVLNIKN